MQCDDQVLVKVPLHCLNSVPCLFEHQRNPNEVSSVVLENIGLCVSRLPDRWVVFSVQIAVVKVELLYLRSVTDRERNGTGAKEFFLKIKPACRTGLCEG